MQTQTKGSVGGVIVLILVVLFIIGAIGSCFGDDHTSKASIVDAVRTQIQKGLINPDDAKFSSYSDTTMTKNSDGTYTVDGYVDDTNAFGAKVRNNYEAQVTVEDNGYSISYKLQNAVTGEWQ
jgi:hypothetical protein